MVGADSVPKKLGSYLKINSFYAEHVYTPDDFSYATLILDVKDASMVTLGGIDCPPGTSQGLTIIGDNTTLFSFFNHSDYASFNGMIAAANKTYDVNKYSTFTIRVQMRYGGTYPRLKNIVIE